MKSTSQNTTAASLSQPAARTLDVDELSVRYGTSLAVDGVSLAIEPGEVVALLGPSGCGKTTLLRVIAGFVRQAAGRVRVDGTPIDHLPANRRNIGIVFQNYALFPHMTVAENVAYGLRARGVANAEIQARIGRFLDIVQLGAFRERLPRQLSGGQQQRVALARALAVEPSILLLDEPFAALDRNLRLDMQIEVKRLQRTLGLTTILVTHDQDEAMSVADRIAVMNKGKVEQVGSPTEIYERPRTRFVADFIGEINILEGGPRARALRPEKIRLVSAPEARTTGKVETANYLGGSTLLRVRGVDGQSLLVRETHAGERASRIPGDAVGLAWNDQDAVMLEG